MNTLQIKVQNKVASYIVRCGAIVCGNSDYQIQFLFDAEWNEYEAKTARFEWNGAYQDVEFTGNICPVPIISNTEQCTVGVYVGDGPDDDAILSSTRTQIPCQRSIRCGAPLPSPDTGEHYTNEAKGYAAEAKASAEVAENAIAHLETYKGMEKIGTLSIAMELGYDSNGMEEVQIGGVATCDGILQLSADDYVNGYSKGNRYDIAIKELFENARIVELTIDTKHGYHQEPVHKEICKGGHMWYGAPKRIEGEMEGSIVGLGVYGKNEGTHLVYADDNSGGDPFCMWGLALSTGFLDCLNYESAARGATLTFTAYR